jgi:hypothetical protein
MSLVLSIIYMADLLLCTDAWPDSKLYIYIDGSNILATGPSYHVILNILQKRYQECLE